MIECWGFTGANIILDFAGLAIPTEASLAILTSVRWARARASSTPAAATTTDPHLCVPGKISFWLSIPFSLSLS